jgi:hypothetical protein
MGRLPHKPSNGIVLMGTLAPCQLRHLTFVTCSRILVPDGATRRSTGQDHLFRRLLDCRSPVGSRRELEQFTARGQQDFRCYQPGQANMTG